MRAIRRIGAVCLALASLQAAALAHEASAPAKVSFYFAAHEDDWQLFMNPSAFADVAEPTTKAVFVHLTAGDAGWGSGTAGRKHPYYLARENGAEAAIHFMADSDLPREQSVAPTRFNGHPIYRVGYRNTVTYFLRLPDGHITGSGYRETGYQSLQRLSEGKVPTLTAIDNSTTYHGWDDLLATLRAIIEHERGAAAAVQLNVTELDEKLNPGDHSDHRMSGKAALEAASGLTCARRLHYINYASAHLPENLTAQQRDMESSVYAVTAAGVLALDHKNIWQRYYQSFLGRSYFRVEEGGPCDPPRSTVADAARGNAERQRSAPHAK